MTNIPDEIERFRKAGSYSRKLKQGRGRATNKVEDQFLRLQVLQKLTPARARALSRKLPDACYSEP